MNSFVHFYFFIFIYQIIGEMLEHNGYDGQKPVGSQEESPSQQV